MNKRKLIFGIGLTALSVIGLVHIAGTRTLTFNDVSGSDTYSLTVDGNTINVTSMTTSYAVTPLGSRINFNQGNIGISGGKFVLTNGHIESTDPLNGLSSITADLNSSSDRFTLKYGWEAGTWAERTVVLQDNVPVNLSGLRPNYFRIEGSGTIASISASYSCTIGKEVFNSGIEGGAHIRAIAQAATDRSGTWEVNIGGAGNADFSGTGVYFRVKNLTGTDTPIRLKMNSTNGAVFGPKTNVKQTYYGLDGIEVYGCDPRNWDNYLMVPANFDGYIYLDYATQLAHMSGSTTFDPAHIWRLYLEVSAFHESYMNVIFGDIFTDTRMVFDASETSNAKFNGEWTLQPNAVDYIELTQYGYTPVETYKPDGDLLGSGHIETSEYSGFHILMNGADLSYEGFYTRLRNNTSEHQYIACQVNSRNGGRVTNAPNAPYYTYDANGTNETEGKINDAAIGYITIAPNFDGYLYLPWTSLAQNNSTTFNAGDIYAVYFEGNMPSFDFGDVFTKTTYGFDGSENTYDQTLGLLVQDFGSLTIAVNAGYKA